jgi:hypothetical protein
MHEVEKKLKGLPNKVGHEQAINQGDQLLKGPV